MPQFASESVAGALEALLTAIQTGGATEATLQAIQALLGAPAQAGEAAAATAPLATEATLALVEAVTSRTDLDGKIRVAAQEYLLGVMEGDYAGHAPFSCHGYNTAVGTAQRVLVDGAGGVRISIPAADAAVVLTSTSALDTAAGDSARSVRIAGWTSAGVYQSETVALAGLADATSLQTYKYLDVPNCYVDSVGTNGYNSGDITIHHTSSDAANVWAVIPVYGGMAQGAWRYIPAGKTAYFVEFTASLNKTVGAAFQVYVQRIGTDIMPYSRSGEIFAVNAFVKRQALLVVPGPAVVQIVATGTASGASISGSLIGWIE